MKGPTKIFDYIDRKFSWDGFLRVNVLDVCTEAGVSRAEAERLFSKGVIKVWDTRTAKEGNRQEWYKRKAQLTELVSSNEAVYCGKVKSIIIRPKPFSLLERIYYSLRFLRQGG